MRVRAVLTSTLAAVHASAEWHEAVRRAGMVAKVSAQHRGPEQIRCEHGSAHRCGGR